MSLTITRLEPQRRNPELVNLHINGEFHSAVAFTAVDTERLHTGDAISPDQLERLLAADERWKARHAALSLLAVRARSRGELGERLRRKGFGAGAIEHALSGIERLGLIDDAAFAEAWVRDRLTLRPRGSQALVDELGRKHVARDVARAAVARVMTAQNVNDDELCSVAAERWLRTHPVRPGEDHQRRCRRLTGFLARRGYRPGAIRAALDAMRRVE